MRRWLWLLAACGLCPPALASEPLTLSAQGQIQVAFTPGDDAGALIVSAIHQARRQILVQAFSFTHAAIAEALIAARRRGVEVQLLADPEQAETVKTSRIDQLAAAGIPVYLDGQHAAAHNKIMVIDAGQPTATVITGSFNFTHAAQYRNAENALLLRGNPLLADAYAANWRRHRTHSLPYRKR
ncbi:phospholipase D-like protein [Sulfuritortus calidifontis]|uniref:phospholipase D n=1 Tax=Sulfuritortus calidifontis TaxID=1914471 RepID=A0A4R3JZ89_9PROT|nr:phospholipase D family protein [Sulfuritortus calidifontis]TCS72417.1 phospholipase D-like protein [Sulfuritortus calidifontis]